MQQFINPSFDEWNILTERPTASYEDLEPLVAEVFEAVKKEGDQAVRKYTAQFDKVALEDLRVGEQALSNAEKLVPEALKAAIQQSKVNIESFHKAQDYKMQQLETQKGVVCWQEKKPIEKVGLYIPGGSAPLFSTILMLAIPAQIAECKEIILCTPPTQEGTVPPVVLYTAQLCGVEKIYTIGGIQAIAAMALGTATIPKVYKIFGPGNQYVTVAKQWATRYQVSIDMPAGPSEL